MGPVGASSMSRRMKVKGLMERYPNVFMVIGLVMIFVGVCGFILAILYSFAH